MPIKPPTPWSVRRKVVFRFLFIFFILNSAPWHWLDRIPGVSQITQWYDVLDLRVVSFANNYLLHVKDKLNVNGGGSGDTSAAWAQAYSYLIFSALGCLLWSLLDRRRTQYLVLDLCLRNLVRYFVCSVAFRYGLIKLFPVQMPFPNLSQLATPLGDFLPMRLSWMFLGYSTQYQMFSGVLELVVGLLLLNRKTVTTGALVGVGVFANVMMLNLSYDVPVKIFSAYLFGCCLYLVLSSWRRVARFFVLNQSTEPDLSYEIALNKKWQKIGRVVLKMAFIILNVIIPFSDASARLKNLTNRPELKPIKAGVYDVKYFIKNNDTIPYSPYDTLVWKDVVFDKGGIGSVASCDTLFRQRYRRGYFLYQPDTVHKTITLRKGLADTTTILTLRYRLQDEKTIYLQTIVKGDSLRITLTKSKRHFQLTEKQFHWLSEANR